MTVSGLDLNKVQMGERNEWRVVLGVLARIRIVVGEVSVRVKELEARDVRAQLLTHPGEPGGSLG